MNNYQNTRFLCSFTNWSRGSLKLCEHMLHITSKPVLTGIAFSRLSKWRIGRNRDNARTRVVMRQDLWLAVTRQTLKKERIFSQIFLLYIMKIEKCSWIFVCARSGKSNCVCNAEYFRVRIFHIKCQYWPILG